MAILRMGTIRDLHSLNSVAMILISTASADMPTYIFVWSDETVEHLEEHGVTPDEFERVVQDPDSNGISRSTGRPYAVAILDDGREVMCIYEFVDHMTIEPITAYELD